MSGDASDTALVVLTTLGSLHDAQSLVKQLVENRLVACGTIVESTRSIYMWQGKLEEDTEALVLLKTRRACWCSLEKMVRDLHPYDVPELLALPVEQGLPSYLAWLLGQTGDEAA